MVIHLFSSHRRCAVRRRGTTLSMTPDEQRRVLYKKWGTMVLIAVFARTVGSAVDGFPSPTGYAVQIVLIVGVTAVVAVIHAQVARRKALESDRATWLLDDESDET